MQADGSDLSDSSADYGCHCTDTMKYRQKRACNYLLIYVWAAKTPLQTVHFNNKHHNCSSNLCNPQEACTIDLRNGKRALQCSLMAPVKVGNDAIEAELIIDKCTSIKRINTLKTSRVSNIVMGALQMPMPANQLAIIDGFQVIRDNAAFNTTEYFCVFSEQVVLLQHSLPRATPKEQEQNAIAAYKMFGVLRCQDSSSVNTGACESCHSRILGLETQGNIPQAAAGTKSKTAHEENHSLLQSASPCLWLADWAAELTGKEANRSTRAMSEVAPADL
ncbi:hypothetical protein Anapl_09203 [Anas platyrhynchos]|uniref:Uncharacterized protein n=1 Tax=Anas platyrhynchos TaxID=8839 RepID=R0LBV1_ANAPL|nr:hypothetical protein Anapl_09203 [Anas platyrhynchos]